MPEKTGTQSPKRESRRLADLLSHPRQAAFFAALSDFDLQTLASDIRRNGLQHPIEILPSNRAGLPPNTIIKGHERKRALILNKQAETTVRVRYDLVDASAGKIERILLEDNQNRKQLDPLTRAQVALRLLEIERDRPRRRRAPDEEAEARDRVGNAIGMSGRNLARYWKVLQTPLEVQHALRDGKLTLANAGRVAALAKPKQTKIAEAIRGGQEPSIAVSKYLKSDRPAQQQLRDPVAMFAMTLTQAVAELNSRAELIDNDSVAEYRRQLQSATTAIKKLMDRLGP